MTTITRLVAPPAPSASEVRPVRAACLRWSWRLVRRSAVLTWLTVAVYMSVEVLSYRSAYPDAASREKLLELSSSTVVRMLQGIPGQIDTAGGFAVWDGGWMVTLIVACWSILTISRLTRGEEDSGRIELLLSRPVTPRQVLVADLTAMGIAATGIGVAGTVPFVMLGEPVAGALLWGAGLGAFAMVVVALGALCAQLVEPRRRVVALGFSLVIAAFLTRIVANSAARRAWLLTVAPFGWIDRLRAFSGDDWLRLALPIAAALALSAASVALATRRDTGAALRPSRDTGRSRTRGLGGPAGFGWRLTSGPLVAWTVILAVSTLVFGLMTGAVVDFIAKDDTYRRLLESMGMDMSLPVVGFLSYMAVFTALPVSAFAGWRLGAARQEEADGRLDNLLARGVVRWRWLATTTALAAAAGGILVITSGASLWVGARLAGVDVTAWQVAEPIGGTLPMALLFTGIAVLTFGVAPRLTVAVPVTLAVFGYLWDTFGALLKWPQSVLGLSPFHHLARLPGTPMTTAATATMVLGGVLSAAAGIAAFSRRDLTGA